MCQADKHKNSLPMALAGNQMGKVLSTNPQSPRPDVMMTVGVLSSELLFSGDSARHPYLCRNKTPLCGLAQIIKVQGSP